MRIIFYTVTNRSELIKFCWQRNIAYAAQFERQTGIKSSAKVFFDEKKLGLNHILKQSLFKVIQDFEYAMRIDDTDALIFNSAINELKSLLGRRLIILRKYLVGFTPSIQDSFSDIFKWKDCMQRVVRDKRRLKKSDYLELNNLCPNGAGCIVPTTLLALLPTLPSDPPVGDDLWLFINAEIAGMELDQSDEIIYCYQKDPERLGRDIKRDKRLEIIRKVIGHDVGVL